MINNYFKMYNFPKRYFNRQIKKALYAGSFDPPSSGHLDIMKRGVTLCDKLYVGIGVNVHKK